MLLEGAFIAISMSFFFGFGWVFFMQKLFKDYEVRNRLVQGLFSITFSLSCALFELMLIEVLDWVNGILLQSNNASIIKSIIR